MTRITDKKGRAHVFTLTDGTTLRVFARKYKDVKDELVSEEIKTAAKLGLVLMGKPTASPARGKQPPSIPFEKGNRKDTEVKDYNG